MTDRTTPTEAPYARYATPQSIDWASHSLEDVLKGVAAGGMVTSQEAQGVSEWLQEHASLLDRHPFDEIKATLAAALADGVLDGEEALDILWLCRRFTTNNEFYNLVSSDMQRLRWTLGRLAIDEIINLHELTAVEDWMVVHEHLRETYPYKELWVQLTGILSDRKISADEHAGLVAFVKEFLNYKGHRPVPEGPSHREEAKAPVTKLCAVRPGIQFRGRKFCFAGKSEKGSRSEVAKPLVSHGAQFSIDFATDLDYLVIGAKGHPAWAFASYGRKVQRALDCQRAGAKMLIVQERDVWKAADSLA